MERIKLTKREKRVLRTLSRQGFDALSGFDAIVIRSLEDNGLVKGAYLEGGGVDDAKLTNMGKVYLMDNPKLRNPLDWKWVVAIVVVVVFILLIIGYALL